MDAYDEAHWQTAVGKIKPGIGVLRRNTVLCAGSGADAGKLAYRWESTKGSVL